MVLPSYITSMWCYILTPLFLCNFLDHLLERSLFFQQRSWHCHSASITKDRIPYDYQLDMIIRLGNTSHMQYSQLTTRPHYYMYYFFGQTGLTKTWFRKNSFTCIQLWHTKKKCSAKLCEYIYRYAYTYLSFVCQSRRESAQWLAIAQRRENDRLLLAVLINNRGRNEHNTISSRGTCRRRGQRLEDRFSRRIQVSARLDSSMRHRRGPKPAIDAVMFRLSNQT